MQVVYDPFSHFHDSENNMNKRPKSVVSTSKRSFMAKQEIKLECICERPKQIILCHKCGESFQGRIKRKCSAHPNVLYLYDVEACTKCRTSDPAHLKEYPIN